MAMHPDSKKIFVLISGVEIRVYDLESKSDELFFKAEEFVSCISLSRSGKYMLVNMIREEELLCLEIDAEVIIAKYSGLEEQRYVLRPCFSGPDSEIVVSGSEGTCHVASTRGLSSECSSVGSGIFHCDCFVVVQTRRSTSGTATPESSRRRSRVMQA